MIMVIMTTRYNVTQHDEAQLNDTEDNCTQVSDIEL